MGIRPFARARRTAHAVQSAAHSPWARSAGGRGRNGHETVDVIGPGIWSGSARSSGARERTGYLERGSRRSPPRGQRPDDGERQGRKERLGDYAFGRASRPRCSLAGAPSSTLLSLALAESKPSTTSPRSGGYPHRSRTCCRHGRHANKVDCVADGAYGAHRTEAQESCVHGLSHSQRLRH
jgi:hypothetical protein